MSAIIARLLGGTFGTILTYAIIGLLGSGILYGVYTIHINTVKANVLAEFNKNQLEQVLKDQKALNDTLEAIRIDSEKVQSDLRKSQEAIDERLAGIGDFLNSDEARKSDREASDILKETVRRLQNGKSK